MNEHATHPVVASLDLHTVATVYEANPTRLPEIERMLLSYIPGGGTAYDDLWRTCEQLLVALPEPTDFLQRVVAPVVAEVLNRTLLRPEWYLNLGFVELVSQLGVEREAIFGHPSVISALRKSQKTTAEMQLKAEDCEKLSATTRDRIVAFLEYAGPSLALLFRHQVASTLLNSLNPSSDTFLRCARLYLNDLIKARLPGLAFVVWHSLTVRTSTLANDRSYALHIRDYIEQAEQEHIVLADLMFVLANDPILLQQCVNDEEYAVTLLAIAFHCYMHDEGERFVEALVHLTAYTYHRLPRLSDHVKVMSERSEYRRGAMSEDITRFRKLVDSARVYMHQQHAFRDITRAQLIWRHIIKEDLQPFYNDLATLNPVKLYCVADIAKLNAEKLVADSPPQRAPGELVTSGLRTSVIKEVREVLDTLKEAYQLLDQKPALALAVQLAATPDPELQAELERAISLGPLSEWAVQRFLTPYFNVQYGNPLEENGGATNERL